MVAISIVASVLAMYLRARLAERIENWLAVVIAAVGFAVVVWGAGALLPDFHEVPDGFPAQTLWEFRLASAGTQVVLWATLGITFAVLFDRAAQQATKRETAAGLAAG